MIRITGMKWAPTFAQGQVRDLRLRWACREAGLPYEMRLVDMPTLKASPDYRLEQPFGQVPVLEVDGRIIFESGAALLEIALRGDMLMPPPGPARDRAISWLFAALSSVEPGLMNLAEVDLFLKDEEQKRLRRPMVVAQIGKRLGDVAAALGDDDWLAGRFTVADLLMATVLRILDHTDILAGLPALAAYKARCEARPAFQAALAEQLADFARHTPADMRFGEVPS